ncbi:MAG: phosphatase PAP2 family protein [Candidatus Rokubacteria bacterium]|nr:phosphatase PAP2 family protein [Candidatus Rokubacteria bacterium]
MSPERDDRALPGTAARWRAISVASAVAFLVLAAAAAAAGALPGDVPVIEEIFAATTPPIRALARVVNLLGTWVVLAPGLALLLLLARDARPHWWLWCALIPISSGLQDLTKEIVGRSRPESLAMGFPSGHTTVAAAFFVLVIYFTGRAGLSPGPTIAIQGAAAASIVAVGLARVVLRSHWPSDVLGGIALGTACAAFAAWWHAARLWPEAAARRAAAPPEEGAAVDR